MSIETAARVRSEKSSHWYLKDGTPFYEVPYADPRKGMRSATLADARKVGAYPGVTTITRILDRPGLNEWITEQAVLAVLSTPRLEGELLDAYVHRVLRVEKVQEEEASKARDTGIQIHDALSNALSGREWDKSLESFVNPVLEWRMMTGNVVWTEKVLLGNGYGGRSDLLLDNETLNLLLLVDFKTCSAIPKDSWYENRLQTSAYATALGNTGNKRINTCNVFISTKKPGDIAVYTQDDWPDTYKLGFDPLFRVWCHMNKYYPEDK